MVQHAASSLGQRPYGLPARVRVHVAARLPGVHGVRLQPVPAARVLVPQRLGRHQIVQIHHLGLHAHSRQCCCLAVMHCGNPRLRTSRVWSFSGRGLWRWCGGLLYATQHTPLAVISSPSLKGAVTTMGHTSPAGASISPTIPAAPH